MSTTVTLKQQLSKTTVNSRAEVLSEDSRGALTLQNTIHGTGFQEGGSRFCSGGCEKLYVGSKPGGGFEERVAFR